MRRSLHSGGARCISSGLQQCFHQVHVAPPGAGPARRCRAVRFTTFTLAPALWISMSADHLDTAQCRAVAPSAWGRDVRLLCERARSRFVPAHHGVGDIALGGSGADLATDSNTATYLLQVVGYPSSCLPCETASNSVRETGRFIDLQVLQTARAVAEALLVNAGLVQDAQHQIPGQ